MNYLSTRGQSNKPLSFCDILLEGLAPDGGLYLPETLPQLSADQLKAWETLSYPELATEVLSLYIDDIPKEDLARLCQQSYTTQAFDSDCIVPLKKLNETMQLVGLSQGPTLAFKDMAMQFLGNIFEYVLEKRHAQLTIVGATSGDTGSAAEYALRGKKGINVFMLSPYGRMSAFQRAQMYSLHEANIFNLAIKGVFDDCQDIVKALNNDLSFKQKYHLGAVNSINFGRIAAQIVYYVWAWLRAHEQGIQQISVAVPSGNFGNILAGHLARQMGVPIHRLILATNENNVLEEFFNTGIYRPRTSEHTYKTSSPSMDISKASNFERFVYDLVGHDSQQVKALWDQLAQQGFFDLSDQQSRFESEFGFVAGQSTHADRLQTIKTVYEHDGVLIDPHTADAVKVAQDLREEGETVLVLETALPAKFSETIYEAIGKEPPLPSHLQNLASLPQYVDVLDNQMEQVRAYIVQHLTV